MKKFLFLALAMSLILPFSSCLKKDKSSDDTELPAGEYDFIGLVDNKNEVKMNLKVNDEGKIKGRYGYSDKIKKDDNSYYTVKGSIFDKNKVTLYVADEAGETVETWNVFAEKDEDDIILKGTLNDSKKNTIYNVVLSTNEAKVQSDIKAPSVEKDDKPAAKEPAEEKAVEKKEAAPAKPLNTSPYAIAPGSHTFNGTAQGKYPIVVYLTVADGGSVSGKMAYKSMLKRGGGADSYMYFNGYLSGNNLSVTLSDTQGNSEDWNLKVSDNGSAYKLSGSAYNYTSGKNFSINVSGK